MKKLMVILTMCVLAITLSGNHGEARKQPDFEAIARIVKLQDGILTERSRDEREAKEETIIEDDCDRKSVEGTEKEIAHETKEAVEETTATAFCGNEYECELYARLIAHGIEWWYPYGRAQMFQESGIGGNPYAENPNGLDKGILQYRITYWSAVCVQHGYPADTSIFDWQAQIAIYTADTARRLRSGCSIEDTISRHKQSDYGAYDAVYVEQVMRWVVY